MANECLVTKLKGVVENQNLPKLGEAIITLVSGSRLCITTKSSVTLTIISGDGIFSNVGTYLDKESDTKIILPHVASDYSTAYFEISGGDAVVSVNSKYNVDGFKVTAGNGSVINIEDFEYSSLTWIVGSGVDCLHGNIACMPELMSFVQITDNVHVIGKTEDIPAVNMNLRLANCGIEGPLEKYVEKLFFNGFLRNNLSCYFGGRNITLGNRTWSSGYECLITVTASNATINMGSYVNETFDGT